jgi:hypothetical protein
MKEPRVTINLTKTELNTFIFLCQEQANRYKYGNSKYTDLMRRLECAKVEPSNDTEQLKEIVKTSDININFDDLLHKEGNDNSLPKEKIVMSKMPHTILINSGTEVQCVSVMVTDYFNNLINYVKYSDLAYNGQIILVPYDDNKEIKVIHPKAYRINNCNTDTPEIQYIGDAVNDQHIRYLCNNFKKII